MTRSTTRSIIDTLALERLVVVALLLIAARPASAQNSMIGDGFGGRSWYRPVNYTVGSYAAYSLCYSDPCDSSSNQLYGWGGDNVGELGDGQLGNCASLPVAIPTISDVRYYSTGYWMGAIKNDGTGWVWGGDGGYLSPTQVITDVKFADAGASLISFVRNDGTVWSIGNNQFGQFGNGTATSNFVVPVQMTGVSNAVRVAVGHFASYVLLADGSVLSVGSPWFGLLGDPTFTDTLRTEAALVPGLSGIVDIKAHSVAAVALTANGDVYSWGRASYTGDGQWVDNDTVPQQVPGLSNVVAISGCDDGDHFLVLDADMNAYKFGNYNFVSWDYSPVLAATNVIDIMAGETFSYVVKADGTFWASGWSLCGSVFLDQPNHGQFNPQQEFAQIDPSAVGSCPLVGTVAIPSATCSSGTITVYHFGGQVPYQYDIGTGPQASNVFADVPLGNYTVSVTDANGCVTMVPCTVAPVGMAPIVVDMGAVYSCSDEGYTFPSGTTTYDPGSHVDTTFSLLGCDTVRLYQVVLTPLPMLTQLVYLCEGDPYTLPNGDVAYAPSYHFIDTLVYVGACDTIFNISLVLSNLPPIVAEVATADSTITSGESVLLSPSPGSGYSWYPSTGLSCTDCAFPLASPAGTTEYCVVVSGNGSGGIGCGSDTACITITVLAPASPVCTAKSIFVPSAFSPNADGTNDLQCVHGAECIKSMVFNIYDRWGNKVFASTDPKACWNGTCNGQALDPAVFVYHLMATMLNGELVERQGNITLVR